VGCHQIPTTTTSSALHKHKNGIWREDDTIRASSYVQLLCLVCIIYVDGLKNNHSQTPEADDQQGSAAMQME
jgi:hypothetical protein